MKRKDKKLRYEATVEDNLIEDRKPLVAKVNSCNNIEDSIAYKFITVRKVPLIIIVLLLLVVTVVISAVVINIYDQDEIRDSSNIKEGTELDMNIGQNESPELSILVADRIDIDYSTNDILKKYLCENVDYKQIKKDILRCVSISTEDFLLQNVDQLEISLFNMSMVNINESSTLNCVYQFLFYENNPVGYVEFYLVDENLNYGISLNTADTYGYFFDFLSNHRDMSFILLTDGYRWFFLSEDNVLYNSVTGTIASDVSIVGDCYHSFDYEKISVSYNSIVMQIEIIR